MPLNSVIMLNVVAPSQTNDWVNSSDNLVKQVTVAIDAMKQIRKC